MAGPRKTSIDKLLALAAKKDELGALVDALRAKGVSRVRVDDIELELGDAAGRQDDDDDERQTIPIEGDRLPEYEPLDDPDLFPDGVVPQFETAPRSEA